MDNDHGIMTQHLINLKGTNDEADSNVAQHKILRSPSTSSESSLDSRDIGKDDISDPLLVSKGVAFAPDVSDFNPRLNTYEPSALCPPNPMMVQAGGYDPNRIPASVFTSKAATPMEWSVASNESLFSIHMGNNSFSRDHVFLIYKSGELPDTNNYPGGLFPVNEAGNNVEKISEDVSKKSKGTEEELKKPAKGDPELLLNTKKEYGTVKNVGQEKKPPAEEVRNSASSSQSFQFPVFEANVEATGSVKVVLENMPSKKQPQQQMQASGTPKKATGSSWFSCFSCCSLGR
ncbi:uncharacterized protein LOC8289595 [Ricinus communis]|uniref:Uncharacterized protein n=1 Tax=Ricinus communis TaxID=3988 RepID=B9SNP7_RICCO|nr:uncharacterized protein LOC8289595 [Ricinus communis]EEF34755.1 conserved hypothetical protein [Ricinus communis]|eukprot:XP_002527616.1 uncharacterized protein LOC8289595 [Ricinus communis]